jgi:redox-sensitive bicupin YhaK (pirin superfamily)
MGRGIHDWLDSHFHFSFAEYFNPENIEFGVLRVINDDQVKQGKGFGAHPHKDMEIVSYCVDGELTHGDSMGNEETLTRGQVQYMSAGTGVIHSEYNLGTKLLRFLQIWIYPDASGYKPNYGDYKFNWSDRVDKWLPIVTSVGNKENVAPIKIHQDVNIYATEITKGRKQAFEVAPGRQAYMVLIEGDAVVSNPDGSSVINMTMRDGLEIIEQDIEIEAKENAHILILEMQKPVSKLN